MNKIIQNLINTYATNTFIPETPTSVKIGENVYSMISEIPELRFSAEYLIKSLKDHGFNSVGNYRIGISHVFTFISHDQGVWVQIHPKGDIAKILIEVNESNPDKIIEKIMHPDGAKKSARLSIEGMLDELGATVEKDLALLPQEVKNLHESLQKISNILR